jgi:ketosteroid isomerase-like protein
VTDATVVQTMYDAVANLDMASFVAVLDPDVKWTVPGTHLLAGTTSGVPALLTHLAEVAQRTGGQVKVDVDEILAGDRHTVAVVDVQMAVEGQTVNDRQVHVFELHDGLITSVREFHGDEQAFNDLFGAGSRK